ncbi:ABC transporter permease [Pedobacter psychroterrae]|uniref:FtsX-like permease family protein n=1 Tax=Pedobacter psychroterrae TaxID=2530453 RepID=A0A4R0NI01_9SPHI|nr:FtsX-like permease family protein [Pedobacter psychroterrae]TCD00222.1 FtsX-like permease family protein [Pedobacter psychroterrae]
MIKHLFTLIWNKRKHNVLFLSEILISFLVIFAVFSMFVFYYLNYVKPSGFEYERVWSISYNNPLKTKDKDTLATFYKQVRSTLTALPQIEELSFSSHNYPYSNSISTSGFSYKDKKLIGVNFFQTDEDYCKVLGINVIEGRWFKKEDGLMKNNYMIINASLKKAMFGNETAIGKYTGEDKDENRSLIIGVIDDVKTTGDYWPAGQSMYKMVDSGAYEWLGIMLLKVSKDADAAFESRLSKILAKAIPNSNIEIKHLTETRESKNSDTVIPVIICSIIAGFLIINVALGLFGVLWYNINQRRGEIGLRRAIGASGSSISSQLVAESMLLATLSLIVGFFFAIQFPLLSVFNVPPQVYLIALLMAIAFIYLLVIVCSLYPGRQAAAIHPAIALHEE